MWRRVVGFWLVAAVMVLGGGSAAAQVSPYVGPPPEVPPEELPPPAPPQVAPGVVTPPAEPDPAPPAAAPDAVPPDEVAQPEIRRVETVRTLPVTGGDLLGLLAIGTALVALGASGVVSTRRRRAAELA